MRENFKKIGSKVVAGFAAVGTALTSAITAFAEGEATTSLASAMNDAVNEGATSAVSNITTTLGNVAPKLIAIVVGVTVLLVGIKWIVRIRKHS